MAEKEMEVISCNQNIVAFQHEVDKTRRHKSKKATRFVI